MLLRLAEKIFRDGYHLAGIEIQIGNGFVELYLQSVDDVIQMDSITPPAGVARAGIQYVRSVGREGSLGRCPGSGVISFNWDLLVEKTLTDAGLAWSYDLDGAAIPVIKPHGSSNWSGHLKEGLRAEYDGWQPLGSACRLCFDAREPLSNPNKQEINSTLRYMIFPGDPELPEQDADVRWLWDKAGEVLAWVQKIVFIGYSLPDYDSFAETFFWNAAADKTIEAITPTSDHLERYRIAFGGRAVLRAEKFEQCEYALPL